MCTRFFPVMDIAKETEVAFGAFPLRYDIEFQNYLYSLKKSKALKQIVLNNFYLLIMLFMF